MRTWSLVLLLPVLSLMLLQGVAYSVGFVFLTVFITLFFFFRTKEIEVFYVMGVDQVRRTKVQNLLREKSSDKLELALPTTQLHLKGKAQ